jgi:hypothetical protein
MCSISRILKARLQRLDKVAEAWTRREDHAYIIHIIFY